METKKKYIAREVPPGARDFRFYFEGDTFKGTGEDQKYAIYIPGDGNCSGLNNVEYKKIVEAAEAVLEGFDDVKNGKPHPFENKPLTYKFVMEDYSIPFTSIKCHSIKDWCVEADRYLLHHYSLGTSLIASFLSITTGNEWDCRSFHGHCQGDYCEVIYCKEAYTEESINEIGHMWLGCGSEFSIGEAKDSEDDIEWCYGFFVIDDVRWSEDERLVKALANQYGCDPDELEVEICDGGHTVTHYNYTKLGCSHG